MNISEKLMIIQTKIKCPKNLYNSFGKYKYRNAESICEAVKPLLTEAKCSLTISDDIVLISDRVYVKSTVTLRDNESNDSVSNTAFARESAEKKGMDSSQVTGATSSYARKYALNGMFLLDDTNDADSDEYRRESEDRSKKEESAPAQKPFDEKLYNSLVNIAMDWINSGKLTNVQCDRANEHIKNKNIDGLTKFINFCKAHAHEGSVA